jgi:hypothetical protein
VGKAHAGPLDRDQGGHTEQEAMAVNADLMRMLNDLGLAGGYVFEWTDEWFKFTWNTVEFELPGGRRQLWRNPLTNEENFGLIAMDAGPEAPAVIDGDPTDWEDNGSQVIFESRRAVREVRAVKDETFLYLKIEFRKRGVWKRAPVALGFDVVPGGNRRLPSGAGRDPDADYSVLVESDDARALVRASLDPIAVLSGAVHGYVPVRMRDLRPGSGRWNLQRQLINRPYTMPTTGVTLPTELFDVGLLERGTSDPSDPEFNARVIWEGAGRVLELRLPYQMIGFSDPSSRRALVPHVDGRITTRRVARVGITVGIRSGRVERTKGYSWDRWNAVSWHERPKAGIQGFADAVADVLTN